MSILLCVALLVGQAELRPTVAIVPPVPERGAESWIGYAIADHLEARLLFHSRYDPKTVTRIYPLNVFGPRQALAAARAEGIDAAKPLDLKGATALIRQLGATHALTGTYTVDGRKVTLTWRFGEAKGKAKAARFDLTDLSVGIDYLAAEILKALAQSSKGLEGHKLASLPLAALKPYAEAVQILAAQSLDPRARLVLPAAEVERARLLLSAATDAKPDFIRAWVMHGIASAMLGEMKVAEQSLIKAMTAAGEFEPTTTLGLFYLYDRQGKIADALKVLEEATQTHLGFLQGLGYLGQGYLRASESHEALRVFSLYQGRVPQSPWARVKRAEAMARTGNLDAAVADTRAVLNEWPASIMVLTALASRLIDANKLVEARQAIEEGLLKHPEHPALLTRLSHIALEEKKTDEALALAELAVQKLGDGRGETLAGYAHLNLGHALALLGREDEAIAALKKAHALGVDAEDIIILHRDPRLKELLNDGRNPFKVGAR